MTDIKKKYAETDSNHKQTLLTPLDLSLIEDLTPFSLLALQDIPHPSTARTVKAFGLKFYSPPVGGAKLHNNNIIYFTTSTLATGEHKLQAVTLFTAAMVLLNENRGGRLHLSQYQNFHHLINPLNKKNLELNYRSQLEKTGKGNLTMTPTIQVYLRQADLLQSPDEGHDVCVTYQKSYEYLLKIKSVLHDFSEIEKAG